MNDYPTPEEVPYENSEVPLGTGDTPPELASPFDDPLTYGEEPSAPDSGAVEEAAIAASPDAQGYDENELPSEGDGRETATGQEQQDQEQRDEETSSLPPVVLPPQLGNIGLQGAGTG